MNPHRQNTHSPSDGKLSRHDEQALVAAASHLFRNTFPNPERIGCPPESALKAAIRKERNIDRNGILDHLTCCSPCFAQYEALLHRHKVANSLKILTVCASVVMMIGLAVWFKMNGAGPVRLELRPQVAQEEPKSSPPAAPVATLAVIDLRNRGPVRGTQPADEAVAATIPATRLDLTVYLPVGSEQGVYEIQILRQEDAPLLALTGRAAFEDRRVVLHLSADLSGFESGHYLLGLRKAVYRWAYYPIAIQP